MEPTQLFLLSRITYHRFLRKSIIPLWPSVDAVAVVLEAEPADDADLSIGAADGDGRQPHAVEGGVLGHRVVGPCFRMGTDYDIGMTMI